MQQTQSARTRLRFDGFAHDSERDGRCRLRIRLEWDGRIHERSCEGLDTVHGRLNLAADTTLRTVAAVIEAGAASVPAELHLVGVKAVRAFDGWVVVARVNGRGGDRRYRLLGSAPCETEEELPRAAVRAVLNAVNRIVESYVP